MNNDQIRSMADELERRYQQIIEEQRLTIIALNSCINGPDSITTENLTIVDRLEKRIQELEASRDRLVVRFCDLHANGNMWITTIAAAKLAMEAISQNKCMCGAKPSCDYEWGPDCDLGNNEAHCKPAHQLLQTEALGGEFAKVLHENLWDLYEEPPLPSSPST